MVNKNIIMLFIVGFIAAAVAVVIVLYANSIKVPSGEISTSETSDEIEPLVATGNIDDAVDSLFLEIEDEQSALGDAESDKSLLFSDTEEISGFSQSVGENEF